MAFRGTSRALALRGLGALFLLCNLVSPHSVAGLHFDDARNIHNDKDCHALSQATVSIVNGKPHVVDVYAPRGEALLGLSWSRPRLHGHAGAARVSRCDPTTA